MIAPRTTRLAQKLQEKQIDHALLSSLASLRYFTGFSAAIETGPSPFTAVPGVLLLERSETPQLFISDSESMDGLFSGISTENFASYTVEKPLAAVADLNARLLQRLGKLPPGKVGIEPEHLPVAVLEPLRSECLKLEFLDITDSVSALRTIKDEEEIEILRECCALCDVGQEMTKKLARTGMTEIELFAELRKGIEAAEGGRAAAAR